MNCLVTGINGTVGGNIFRTLSRIAKYKVWGISRRPYKYADLLNTEKKQRLIITDLRNHNSEIKELDEIEAVLHAAAVTPSYKGTDNSYDDNPKIAEGIARLFQHNTYTKFIFLSSGSVYSTKLDVCEESSVDFSPDEYGQSMRSAEMIFAKRLRNVFIFRLFYPFSFDEHTEEKNLISKLRSRIINGSAIEANSAISGRSINPFYFPDIFNLIDHFLSGETGGPGDGHTIFNVAGPDELDFVTMLEHIAETVNKSYKLQFNDQLQLPLYGDISRLKEVVNSSSLTKFEIGIKHLAV